MKTARFRLSFRTLLLIVVTGCGEIERNRESASVQDSAGVQLVQNGRVGLWGELPPKVEEVLRIGVVEGNDALQFYQVYSLAVAEDGTIFVGNNQTASVRVFTPDGQFLREFGRKGRGPGEYYMVNRVWLAGDSVVITDWQGGGRTGLYTRDGQLEAFWNSTAPDGSRIVPEALTPNGWLARSDARYNPPTVAPGEKWERPIGLVRFDPATGTVGDTVYSLPSRVLYGSPQTEGMDWALFDPVRSTGFDGAGNLLLSYGEPYRIDVFDGNGKLTRGISREHDPLPVTEKDIDELKGRVREFYDTMTRRPPDERSQERDRVVERVDRQRRFNPRPYLPPLRRLLVSHDGSFWVERADAAAPAVLEMEALFGGFSRARLRATRWDLFDAEGRYLSTVDLDPRFTPHAARGLEVTGVLKDELDVEYVVTYRVARIQ